MTSDLVQRLAEHAAARDAWLAATSGQLRGDERVAAVWLVGSLGQESGDAWSDLDLVVVARDEHLPALAERPRSEFGRFGGVLVAIDAPNGPAGGASLGLPTPLASCRCGSTGMSGRCRPPGVPATLGCSSSAPRGRPRRPSRMRR